MFEQYEDVLTPQETLEALRIGRNALYQLLKSGKLKSYKNGRIWRIPKNAIKNYIIENSGIRR